MSEKKHAFDTPSERAEQERWQRWQQDVLKLIRTDLGGVLESVDWEDVDWAAWRPLFEQGLSPAKAIENAFGKVA